MYDIHYHTKKHMNQLNEDEIFARQKTRTKPPFQKIVKSRGFRIILLLILLAILFKIITGAVSSRMAVGNTSANLVNCGYAVQKGNYIYYVSPSDDMYTTQISRVKIGKNESEVIYQGSYDIRALNIVGNKLYFISLSSEAGTDEDGVDNKIYKMNLDGSDLTVINDNDFAYDYDQMYIVQNRIYYVGTDLNVYQMNLNGENRKLVAETGTGFLTMNKEYILYNKDNQDATDYITYIRPLKGGQEREVNSSRINTPMIDKDFIYYINSNQHLAKIPLSGGEEEEVTDYTIYQMNIVEDHVYYLNYKDEANQDYTVAVFKRSLKGGEPQILKELSNYSSFLNIVDDYVYYMDMDDEKAFINLVNVNDMSEIRLHEWNYVAQ